MVCVGLPMKEIGRNLNQIIDGVEAIKARGLITQMLLPPNYGPKYAAQFAQLFEQIGDEREVAVTPFVMQAIFNRADLMQADRLHPNELAQPFMLDIIWPRLVPHLEMTQNP